MGDNQKVAREELTRLNAEIVTAIGKLAETKTCDARELIHVKEVLVQYGFAVNDALADAVPEAKYAEHEIKQACAHLKRKYQVEKHSPGAAMAPKWLWDWIVEFEQFRAAVEEAIDKGLLVPSGK